MKDKDLLALIKDNPEAGIEKAMALYGKAVNTICSSILRNAPDGLVDEAVSETFFKLWRGAGSFRAGDGASLKSYVYSIARNASIDLWRREKERTVSIDDEQWFDLDSGYSVEGDVQERMVQEEAQALIESLGEPDHTVFLCKFFLGMGNREIAEKLQLKEKKIENILYRGKAKLKKVLLERGIQSYEE